jgi:hypothetical protein
MMRADRLISLAIAAVCCVIGAVAEGGVGLFRALVWVMFALALIWFGDELGEYTGLMRGQAVTATSPGWLVKLFGWLFLLGPLLYMLYLVLSGARSTGHPS